jgi:hypothetical protein
MDCQFTPSKCAQIRAGIDYLAAHPSALCHNIGVNALGRYNLPAGTGGFKTAPAEWGNDFDMAVPMNGLQPTSPYIFVAERFWSSGSSGSDRSTGGLIAHEEGAHMSGEEGVNHDGMPGYNGGLGQYLNDVCTAEY